MNSKEAREFLIKKGIPMSKSKLYKLTSSNEIIFYRVGNRLVFYDKQLTEWCKTKIVCSQNNRNTVMDNIIHSAQKSNKFYLKTKKMRKYRCKTCNSTGTSQKFCNHCATAFCTNCHTTASGEDIPTKDRNTCPVCENIGGVMNQNDRWKKIS